MCGLTHANCPGVIVSGTYADLTCERCKRSIAAERRREGWGDRVTVEVEPEFPDEAAASLDHQLNPPDNLVMGIRGRFAISELPDSAAMIGTVTTPASGETETD
jgi:hypothetical protein